MRRTIIIALISALFLLISPFFANAQTVGCCCDPVVKNGSFSTPAACAALGFTFVGPPPSIAVTCSQHCNATLAPIPDIICGDGICRPGETAESCPADCAAIVTGCGSPAYRPSPTNLTIAPLKGKKAISLSFTLPCPADYLNISRCTGTACENFKSIAIIPSATVFVDEDPDLQFNTDYTYSIIAHYPVSGNSDPATATGNPGDLECWHQGDNQFCINYFTYDQFREYLTNYGYGGSEPIAFSTSFGRTVNITFATRLNQAWLCNAQNMLISPSPQVRCDARQNQFCIADEKGPRCATLETCSTGFDPFGLYATQQACELFGIIPRYCFIDKSPTVADKCYSCDPRMTCYDYKSQKACEKDNCGAGDCQWNPIYEDIGIGVCIDKRYNNCKLCTANGTAGMENSAAASAIWDSCREEKSNALSNALYPCFFDKDRKISKTCDEATCSDYTALQCNSPPGGIRLNPDNSIAQKSTDVCNIGVCEYHLTTGCVKNADGSTGAGFQDCKIGNNTCEMDYFPPTSALIPIGQANRIDFINIRIFDKINKTSPPQDHTGKPGYILYLCVKNATNTCLNAQMYSIATSSNTLSLKNTILRDGNKTIAKLPTGNNTLWFYSRDASNNLEIIRHIDIYSCDNCQGPQLLELNVTGGRVIGKTIYTSAKRPTFSMLFDEPTQITYVDISRPGEGIALQQETTGMTAYHRFTPITDLLGTYNFSVNGHNAQNIYVNPSGINYALVVDPELAGLTIIPPDGSYFNKTSVDITLNFTRPVTLDSVQLLTDIFDDPHARKETSRDITTAFKTTNNQTFTAKIDNLAGGRVTIAVDAQGFNGLDIYKQSSFYVATRKPGIRLLQPAFGVTPYSIFNVTIETPLPSNCAYVYDTPTPPSATDFEFFKPFEGTGTLHTATEITIPYNAQRAYPIHVYCNFEEFGIIQRTFNLTQDTEPVRIVKAYAEPAVIAEQYIPEKEIYATTLKVQLSKPGFCKYSLITSNFPQMENTFPGYDILPKESLGAAVNVTEKKSYSYHVVCKGKNQLLSQPASVPFTVDLSLPLNVSSSTPIGFGTLNFTIGVVANKRVFCYFGERPDDTTRCMGACTSGYTQWQQITVQNPGAYTYYVKCAHVSGEQSDIITIPVLIDTTPPIMEYVNDDGVFEDDPDITWSKQKIRVAYKGKDEDVNISHYLVTLQGLPEKQAVIKDLVSNITDGEYHYISQTQNGSPFTLQNNKRYSFSVKAVSQVGLVSEPMESDGVRVDISREPEPCQNGDKDPGETGIDCGGECDGCPEGTVCTSNEDCATNYCDGTCKVASCEDGAQNGLESDVDCGGQICKKCQNDKGCIRHTDCDSGYCDLLKSICTDAPPCANKALDPGETDIDCGGPCDRCGEGKTCEERTDCEEQLWCKPDLKICSSEQPGDADFDKITDDIDECPNTPPDEQADERGCGSSQRYSLGDEINDRWRMDNFGCIDCSQAASDADPDRDKLTNIEEFRLGTNPTMKDTDDDGWSDYEEVQRGTNPLDPASHPPSVFLGFLKVLFIILAISGIVYGTYIVLQQQKAKKKPITAAPKAEGKPAKEIAADEIEKLRTFAKEEEIPDKDWVPLEKEIKKKPLPPKKFHEALERLRTIAHKERVSPEAPLLKLRAILEELSEDEQKDLIARYKLLKAGLLTAEEMEELFRKLRITAEYYKTHKEELDKELAQYGKRRKH
ncbi:MAG: thrombospondin type 3 repeat-containing protein [Candidatus Woesearchaeota archaeon]